MMPNSPPRRTSKTPTPSSASSSSSAKAMASKASPGKHIRDDSSSIIGLLEVYIASARDLRPPSLVAHLSKLNPYIKVTLGSQSHSTATPATSDRSSTSSSSSCPAWDEYATFTVTESTRLLRVECWDRARLVADSMLGYGVIELDAVLKAEKCVTGWFGLKHSANGKEVGKIQLHLAFYPKDISQQGRVHAPGLAMSPLCLASGSSSAAHNSRSTICVSSLASALTQLVHTPEDDGASRKPSSSRRPSSMAALYQGGRDRHASSASNLSATDISGGGTGLASTAAAGEQRQFRPRNRSSICFDLNVEPEQQPLGVPPGIMSAGMAVQESKPVEPQSTQSPPTAAHPARPYPLAPFSPSTNPPNAAAIPTPSASPACVDPPPEFFQLDERVLDSSQPELEEDPRAAPPPTAMPFPTTLRLADLAPTPLPAPPVPRIHQAAPQRQVG